MLPDATRLGEHIYRADAMERKSDTFSFVCVCVNDAP